jgi:hypothetical protein
MSSPLVTPEAQQVTKRKVHMCIDLQGVLQWPKREFDRMFKGACKDENGRVMTPDEVRAEMLAELAKGHKVIPYGEPCEGFDYQTGCPGHKLGA